MSWKIKPVEELCCPNCKGQINTIHPYYSAAEYSEGFNPYVFALKLIPIGMVAKLWWPLGIILIAWLIFHEMNRAKKAVLYKCQICNLDFSYNELFIKDCE